MTAKKTFLSVVLPTFNRGHLIDNAIKSVLHQTFEDFELIISNSASTDNTKDVIADFNDKRIIYVETQKKLKIGENYLNALNYAGGEYIIFLADDDAFSPNAFERVKKNIDKTKARLLSFQYCTYFHDDDLLGEVLIPANSLMINKYTGDVSKFSSKDALRNLYTHYQITGGNRSSDFIIPFVGNAFYHHTILKKIREKRQNPFDSTPADMYLTGSVFYNIDNYYCLDEPLLTCTKWAENATASASKKKGTQLREHYERLLDGETLDFTPLKFALPQNCYTNTLLKAKKDFDIYNSIEINWAKYFILIYNDLQQLESVGVDTSKEMKEFETALESQSTEIKRNVLTEINKRSFSIKKFLRTKLPFIRHAINKVFVRDLTKYLPPIIKGEEKGIKSVLTAAQYIGSCLEKDIVPYKDNI